MKFLAVSKVLEAQSSIPGQIMKATDAPTEVNEFIEKNGINPDTVLRYKLETKTERGLLSFIFGQKAEPRTTLEITTLENGSRVDHLMVLKPKA